MTENCPLGDNERVRIAFLSKLFPLFIHCSRSYTFHVLFRHHHRIHQRGIYHVPNTVINRNRFQHDGVKWSWVCCRLLVVWWYFWSWVTCITGIVAKWLDWCVGDWVLRYPLIYLNTFVQPFFRFILFLLNICEFSWFSLGYATHANDRHWFWSISQVCLEYFVIVSRVGIFRIMGIYSCWNILLRNCKHFVYITCRALICTDMWEM